jgi:hypothetical protein
VAIGTRTPLPPDLALRIVSRGLLREYEVEVQWGVASHAVHPSARRVMREGPRNPDEERQLAAAYKWSAREAYSMMKPHIQWLAAALAKAAAKVAFDMRDVLRLMRLLAAAITEAHHDEPRDVRDRDRPPERPLALLTDRTPVGPPGAPVVRPHVTLGEPLAA